MAGDISADAPAARIVLDTNVCLDLLVFDDPRIAPLAHALQSQRVIAVATAETREEWVRVLGYPILRLDTDRRRALTAAFDALVHYTDDSPCSGPDAIADKRLPRCIDSDDQKFLDLARSSGARWLLSRDRDLLVLAARCRRDGRFWVMSPQAWADDVNPSATP